MQILARNPFAAVDPPQRAMPKTDAYTDAEIATILEAAASTRWDAAIMFALATGVRCGEAMAVRWDDVRVERDALGSERGTVTIRASFSQTKATGVTLKATKTERVRTIPLSSLALEALEQQRFRQGHDASKAQDGYEEHGFVFTDPFGRPYTPYAFSDAFRKLARRTGIRKRLHDARHTAASHLLAAGVDIRTAATILGHSSPQMTLNVYAHQLAGLKDGAMSKLDESLRAAIQRHRAGER